MFAREQSQTYLARGEVDVRMTYWRDELHLWRCEGIVLGKFDGEQPETSTVWRGRVAGTLEYCFPAEEV